MVLKEFGAHLMVARIWGYPTLNMIENGSYAGFSNTKTHLPSSIALRINKWNVRRSNSVCDYAKELGIMRQTCELDSVSLV
jgi:hypothetical protein